jgi:hypothetical protein
VGRPPRIHHSTSEPFRFFGRTAELRMLDEALAGADPSVAAFVGPGGQGKTAIVQHWLQRLQPHPPDGLFFWSFYRGKDADLCLRELYAFAEGLDRLPEVSASYCVDRLIPRLQSERWALALDGAEVAQHDGGSWRGRFLHPELGRLLEELASAPMPGVVVLTSRFHFPSLEHRSCARLVSLSALDPESARSLLRCVGVHGTDANLDAVAAAGGRHAKAVELLGTLLARYYQGAACRHTDLSPVTRVDGATDEEHRVDWVLTAYRRALSPEAQDLIALATAFREAATETSLLAYLTSPPVRELLHTTWHRTYVPFANRPAGWLAGQVDELVQMRLLERVGRGGRDSGEPETVIDAHPLVRRAFEHHLGPLGQRQSATARAGFLYSRPDRTRPQSLEQAREEVELFHAFCDAGLWNEADSAYRALDNPKHRFLAPALEHHLLLRFFPAGDWRQPPLWPGFGRYRSLAICLELLGEFDSALEAYRAADAPLRGDALLALGRLTPLLEQPQAQATWQTLWHAYRCHALCLAGRVKEAVNLARSIIPVDVYEWLHVFECLLRAGRLDLIDLHSVLARPAGGEHRWAELARRRMRADFLRLTEQSAGLAAEYEAILDAYDRAGLPLERALTRLSFAQWLWSHDDLGRAEGMVKAALALADAHEMKIAAADGWAQWAAIHRYCGNHHTEREAGKMSERIREETGYRGPPRP